MKTFLSILINICSVFFSSNLSNAQNIPDPDFRNVLTTKYGVQFDDSNNISNPLIIPTIKRIDVNNKFIDDLTGIEEFTSLTFLNCSANNLTALDLRQNLDLDTLICWNSYFDELNLENNTKLKYLDATYTYYLTELNLTSNVLLTTLLIGDNSINTLNLNENTNLTYFNVSLDLSALDLSKNTKLETIYLRSYITEIDLSQNTNLKFISIEDDSLTNLILPVTDSLKTFYLTNYNSLLNLDISNNLSLNDIKFYTHPWSINPTSLQLKVWALPFPPEGVTFQPSMRNTDFILKTLPVELSNFSAINKNENILLSWETKSETNNYGWDVEYRNSSFDNSIWEKSGFVGGKGTTSRPNVYSYEFPLQIDNLNIRLKQIDMDGKFHYSNILSVQPTVSNFVLHQNYPNPFNPSTLISYQLAKHENIKIEIYDLTGKIISIPVNKYQNPGTYQFTFDGSNLSNGVYFYKVYHGSDSVSKKMLLIK